MLYWWVTPWIILWFVLFIIWTALGLGSLKDFFIHYDIASYIWFIMFLLWSIPLIIKIVFDFLVPLFLLFWFSFKP